MENNNHDQSEEEEVPNLEQFQVGRSPSQEKADEDSAPEDNGYTSDEVEFADGEGTQLNEENPYPDEDETNEAGDVNEADEADEVNEADEAGLDAGDEDAGNEDADFEDPDDHPA